MTSWNLTPTDYPCPACLDYEHERRPMVLNVAVDRFACTHCEHSEPVKLPDAAGSPAPTLASAAAGGPVLAVVAPADDQLDGQAQWARRDTLMVPAVRA